MQRQLNGVYEQIVIPPVLTVVVRPVVDDLPDDLLDPTTDAVERPVEAPLHGQSALGAVALAARLVQLATVVASAHEVKTALEKVDESGGEWGARTNLRARKLVLCAKGSGPGKKMTSSAQ